MVWRFIVRYLMNDQVVNKIADSYPIRRAAQWVVYVINRSKAIRSGDELFSKKNEQRLRQFSNSLEDKLKRIAEDLERRSKKNWGK